MKRIYLLLTMIIGLTFTCHAKVALLVVGGSDADTALPFDGYGTENNPELSPERATYTWFNNSYTTSQDKTRILIGSLQAAESSVPEDVDVLWINLDRNEHDISFESGDQNYDNIFNSNVVTALSNFVKRGGNLLLTKQAARIVAMIGRTALYPTCEISYIGMEAKTAYTQKVVPTHKIFAGTGEGSNYNLVSTYYPTFRESLWDNLNTDGDRSTFETDNTCKILGYNDDDNKKAGIVEFYPKGDYQGTVLVIGVFGYQWCPDAVTPVNTYLDNVKKLTKNALDYLCAEPNITWDAITTGVIGSTVELSATAEAGFDVAITSQDETKATYSDGNATWQYFGSATLRATATPQNAQKGIQVPKNATTKTADHTVTISGGDPAKYGYVLTYSLHTLDGENLKPDYTAAKWFYDNYVSQGTGCFINPTDYSSSVAIPSEIKVLWVHSDKWGLASADYYTALGGDNFRDALKNYIIAGGNAFLSKQATRLIGDIGRAQFYPCYEFAGSEYSSGASDTWYMTDDFKWVGTGVSRHWHRAFRFMTGYRTDDNVSHWPLVSAESSYRRTDHWYLWGKSRNGSHETTDTWNNYGCEGDDCDYNEKGRLTNFESKQKCTILGGWGHTANLDAVGMAEFYPATVSATDFKGSVITMGLGTYQWTTDNTCANMAKLTKGVLEYLTDVPFVIHHNGDSEGDPREVNNYKETYAGGNIGTTIETGL